MRVAGILLGIASAVVAARLAYIYYARSQPVETPRAPAVAKVPPELDTRELKILNFYMPEPPVRGRPATLCYGVLNAVSVRLDPPLSRLGPSLSRCVEVVLREETELKLTAAGRDGEEAAVSFRVGVAEPRPEFGFVNISAREIRRGEKFTLCYGVKNAAKVRVEPGGPPMAPGERLCYVWYPMRGPLSLIAESPGGRDEIKLPLKVR